LDVVVEVSQFQAMHEPVPDSVWSQWQDVFHELDSDGDGYVDIVDFATRLVASGKIPGGGSVQNALRMFDFDGDAQLDSVALCGIFL